MLDRLIVAVYDSAEGGKFKARHDMAEWLGCSIPTLYEVLESMGHRKIYDPAEEAEAKDKTSEDGETKKESTEPQEKPELATFRLRKGKAYQSSKGDKKRKPGNKSVNNSSKAKSRKAKHKKKVEKKPAVFSAVPEQIQEDSPFAVLKKLNVKGSDD
jgi:ATP-dependent RNA helicase SUPV3L1/SUV3